MNHPDSLSSLTATRPQASFDRAQSPRFPNTPSPDEYESPVDNHDTGSPPAVCPTTGTTGIAARTSSNPSKTSTRLFTAPTHPTPPTSEPPQPMQHPGLSQSASSSNRPHRCGRSRPS